VVVPTEFVQRVPERDLRGWKWSVHSIDREADKTIIALDAADYEAAKRKVAARLLEGRHAPGDWLVQPCENLGL
jgi:hypothetical protein